MEEHEPQFQQTQRTREERRVVQGPSESPPEAILRDFYPVNPPFGNVAIRSISNVTTYEVIEPSLTEIEKIKIERLKSFLLEEVRAPLSIIYGQDQIENYLDQNTSRLIKDYKLNIPKEAQNKILYYLKRDFLGYSHIDVMMRDPNIEDISCDGVGIPIYVWHRDYESIPSNVQFNTKEDLGAFIIRLAYKSGGQITVAKPILEGNLPEGYRTHLTLDEVSKRGSTFTIRKFREEPPTIVDLMLWGTISPQVGAYLWICIENMKSLLVVGATATGKTTTLGALAMFIKPDLKIVTIEELREVKLPHENWIPMVTRVSSQAGVEEVGLFDLLKSALRQRPDYIVVGEIRGEEAYTLLQAISTGHGGISTIHADSVSTAMKRMLTKPMDIPGMLLPLMSTLVLMARVKLSDRYVRRAINVAEVVGFNEQTRATQLNSLFEWAGELKDTFDMKGQSNVFKQLANEKHLPEEEIYSDMEKKEKILQWMLNKKIHSYREVASVIRRYYYNPTEVFEMARLGEDWQSDASG
ncbi:MAG TPA: type II/IV secretion system ATPase subunit [Nitrososphaerales archaeon]|nr:type II/IV secretion system ATPase subunit [Nitrososphaerales archaeon]